MEFTLNSRNVLALPRDLELFGRLSFHPLGCDNVNSCEGASAREYWDRYIVVACRSE